MMILGGEITGRFSSMSLLILDLTVLMNCTSFSDDSWVLEVVLLQILMLTLGTSIFSALFTMDDQLSLELADFTESLAEEDLDSLCTSAEV